ncbi:MAG: ATP-dependent DNA ligase [Actinomycetes bacterium]
MLLVELADTSGLVARTSSRAAKISALADVLGRAAPDEVAVVVAYLSGELRQRRTGLGYAALRDGPGPAVEPSLGVAEVDREFARLAGLSGAGSQGARRAGLHALMARATPVEQHLLGGLVSGELRQGAQDGVMAEAVARAAQVPASDVRRAVTVSGALVPVAEAALASGQGGLDRFRLQVGTPLKPMLAASALDVADALARTGEAAVEWKLDGVRIQVHRDGDDVAVFTRTLDEVSARVPEVVEAVLALPARRLVLDGEAIALDEAARPRAFQVTASRTSSRVDVAAARARTPLTLFTFDALHVDGEDLVGLGGADRFAALAGAVPEALRIPRTVTADPGAAAAVLDEALAHGHEGVLVKSLDATYEAGRRGSGWVKVKPRHTLDLVVLAAEWGHGRRRGWLSNLHLGARDPAGVYGEPGGFVMLGKTFKGLTDAMLTWQTERLLQLAVEPGDWVVHVRPQLVVEVAFDGVQSSPRYPTGMALRFARVLHHRPDKPATEADTVEAVAALHTGR